MEKHTILADDGTSLTLPVTPLGVTFPTAKDYKVVNIAELGEYVIPGYAKLGNIRIPELLIPAQRRSFCADWTEQRTVTAWLERMASERRRCRYVVTGGVMDVSYPCYIVSFEPGQQDGSGDIYASLILQQWQAASAPVVETKPAPVQRDDPVEDTVIHEQTYTVKSGDCLWTICQTFYSDGSLAAALAKYNGIANANIIFAGQVIKIPPKDSLDTTAKLTPTAPRRTATPSGTTEEETAVRNSSPAMRADPATPAVSPALSMPGNTYTSDLQSRIFDSLLHPPQRTTSGGGRAFG